MSNVDKFPWSWFLEDRTQVLIEGKKFRRRLFTLSIKREIRHFHVVVVQ